MAEIFKSEKTVSAFGHWLLTTAMERGISLSQLATKANIQPSSLYKLINTPDAKPKLPTVHALAGALDIPMWRLVEACGYDLGISDKVAA